MSFEKWKTLILSILVSLSLLLTLAIWNYQPNFAPANSDQAIEAQLNGQTQTKKQTIFPTQIIYHLNNGDPLGLVDKQEEKSLYEQMQNWSIFDFTTTDIDYEEHLENNQNKLEVIFPTELPNNLLTDLFTVEDEFIPEGNFNRMLISLEENNSQEENIQILFAKGQTGTAIQANIQNYGEVVTFLQNYEEQHEMVSYEMMKNSEDMNMYLPREVNLSSYLYSYQELEVQRFIDFLFKNPSAVKRFYIDDGSLTYSDGIRELKTTGNRVNFANPVNASSDEGKTLNDYDLLDQVHNDFMNSHLGFTATDPFHYVLTDLSNTPTMNMVRYTLKFQGYPVYENQTLTTISVEWHNQAVYKYTHPQIKLSDSRGPKQSATDLFKTSTVVSALKNGSNYENNLIYDVAIGYKVEEQSGDQVFKLTPTWYVKGSNGWSEFRLPEEMAGGDNNAMGTN
ncbi:two-component system WalR/WalK regulatory protein YycH [Paraliobacillus ryukyuensis]|uniref:Regulatory protein YycH of two-component signal transduction system YycFG n=1 Tax=Paraliobacillus ryukyuensis TaxID=200904 RepID=A0A366EC43_9BACI|nr:two-component system activity regulator YycH [Paraliobacillus ryukyuensis]RBO99902.1 regulatory protein YycH of two-component signal transduction system YycFG [Paraliobacillus ryukyuensis]